MQIEPWHVPLLVMAGIIVLELLAVLVLRDAGPAVRQFLRTAGLGTLALVLLVVVVVSIGPSLADQLASVAAAIAGIAALWLTYRSHRPSAAPPTVAEQARTAEPGGGQRSAGEDGRDRQQAG
ncbi:hypothetical protein [Solwaraspora sp. WMMA2065]|uniref:hypothetical protein n=1 Tax=Solwaraspora sp. WMMA2065 TaxID=3015166 RepID=UPI00259B84A5|nr:hypothetical protein [Solwaraspora sp. WMMA2065]WJK32341.1 hypothetical protein O7610_16310 [Solwaraspora sp. WMMA2065]